MLRTRTKYKNLLILIFMSKRFFREVLQLCHEKWNNGVGILNSNLSDPLKHFSHCAKFFLSSIESIRFTSFARSSKFSQFLLYIFVSLVYASFSALLSHLIREFFNRFTYNGTVAFFPCSSLAAFVNPELPKPCKRGKKECNCSTNLHVLYSITTVCNLYTVHTITELEFLSKNSNHLN